MNRLAIHLPGLSLKNPIIPASGTYGFGYEFSQFYDINCLGSIMLKGTTIEPRYGNSLPRIAEGPIGILNAIGLQNPGVDAVMNVELEKLKMKLEKYPILELAMSTSGYIEITHRDAKKGLALEQLCRHLGISMEDVMAIGDNVNDSSMLSKVGLPVAVGNAKEEIRQMAKYVTASNDDNGVAQAVEKWVLCE